MLKPLFDFSIKPGCLDAVALVALEFVASYSETANPTMKARNSNSSNAPKM